MIDLKTVVSKKIAIECSETHLHTHSRLNARVQYHQFAFLGINNW